MNAAQLNTTTTTVSVFTRHSADCSRADDPQWKRCRCRKWLYIYRNGKPERVTAKTRSWDEAERRAQETRDSFDPLKQKQRELDRLIAAKKADAILIDVAIDQWFASFKNHSDGTRTVYMTFVRKLKAWTSEKGIEFLTDVTAAVLDEWRGQWSLKAKRDDDRMGDSTQSDFQTRLKSFFAWAHRNKMIDHDPAFGLKGIKKMTDQTLPLNDEQFNELMDATQRFDDAQRRECDKFGVDLRALFILMRWTGLRIGDAAAVARDAFSGHRLTFKAKKTGKLMIPVPVPDVVLTTLAELPRREGVHPNHYFWTRQCKLVSLSSQWDRKIDRLNEFLDFKDEGGQPLKFHSHMLRDTFAVNMLLNDVPLDLVSKMLGHSSVKVTERHYAPWIKARQRQLEERMIAAFQSQGASVSFSR